MTPDFGSPARKAGPIDSGKDTRNYSQAKLLGISKRRLALEAFTHPAAKYDNDKIRARGDAYWAIRHAEEKKERESQRLR